MRNPGGSIALWSSSSVNASEGDGESPVTPPGGFPARPAPGGLVGSRRKVCSKGQGAGEEPTPGTPGTLRAGVPVSPRCPWGLLGCAGCGLGQSSSCSRLLPSPALLQPCSPPFPLSTGTWDLKDFVHDFHLGQPVASTQFLTKNYKD